MGSVQWKLFVRTGFDELFDRKAGKILVGAVALAVASFAGLATAVMNLANITLRNSDQVLPVLRQLFAAPPWWPSWYPMRPPTDTDSNLPGTIRRFRLMTWWGIPILSWLAIMVAVGGLARTPVLGLGWVRFTMSLWIGAACSWGVWLFSIVGRYRQSEIYDALELAEVAVFRQPVADIARAFPEPLEPEPEPQSPTVLGSARLHAWLVKRLSPRAIERLNAAPTAARVVYLLQVGFLLITATIIGGWLIIDPSIRAGSPDILTVLDRLSERIAKLVVSLLS